MSVLAGTGHRPDKLGGYSDHVFSKAVFLAETYLKALPTCLQKTTIVISGMALGWDMALAQAAINLQPNVELLAAVPFEGQEKVWPSKSQSLYRALLARADEVEIVSSGGYAAWKMQTRNEWMVDHCQELLALWNGSEGGTANCIKYAEKVGCPVINLWSRWEML